MSRVFVDANVFLRFLTQDDAGQCERAARLFEAAAAGRLSLITGPPVLFEIAWTLRARYDQPCEVVLDVLSRILALPGLEMTDASLVEEAIRLAGETGQEFPDAYMAATLAAVRADAVATFDREHFEKLGVPLHAL